jgi:hypothetical protein
MFLSVILFRWGFTYLAVCDPAGEEYTGSKRMTVHKDKAPVFEREVEVASMCKFSGIQKKYKWQIVGGV